MLTTLPAEILPEEIVVRYILTSSEYSKVKLRVKYRAFEPSPTNKFTSVFRVSGLKENKIWEQGRKFVAIPRNRTLYARADISVSNIRAQGLGIFPAEPPPRYANIVNWPDEKHAIMALAQKLAADAALEISSD